MRRATILCLLLASCTTNEKLYDRNQREVGTDIHLIKSVSFHRLSLLTDDSLTQRVSYTPNILVPKKNFRSEKEATTSHSDSPSNTGPFRVVTTNQDQSMGSTSVYVESKNNLPLYFSSLIAAIGILLNGIVFLYTRKDKNRDHSKGVIDEFWYRTILMPELRYHAKEFVKDNIDFWSEMKSKTVYAPIKSEKFIKERFNVHYHKVLMSVENIKMIDSEFSRGEEVQGLFENLEDRVVDASYSMRQNNFHERLVKINEIIDSINELEPKLTSILLSQHRDFSGIETQNLAMKN
ncbi:hypothetical protein Q8W40_11905 [Vibrio penaeicida]|uniref:hypothetical protein n=1 Tax=Vibrio penaeicida TaxID=104609 RepID=UPI0027372E4F|nr:hypothetical protein [Vibrio penaeicida]MDP2572889.1 hypothetical protein [Vibrio penaeicida]